jgi:hypothetical protein
VYGNTNISLVTLILPLIWLPGLYFFPEILGTELRIILLTLDFVLNMPSV